MNIEFKYLVEVPQFIQLIADWYFEEWEIPKEKTLVNLQKRSQYKIPFQLVAFLNGDPIATGGIEYHVGLLEIEPRFKKYSPWGCLLYTKPEKRNLGVGKIFCNKIDEELKKFGVEKYYLFTFTAEKLYKRLGWKEVERVQYKGNDTTVMVKELR